MISVRTLDSRLSGLDRYYEDVLLQVWDPVSVATASRDIHKVIHDYLVRTGDPSALPFKLVDFGMRGVSCMEEAGIAGMAHLIWSKVTDNWMALLLANEIYGEEMAGFSVPASEHGVTSPWLKENEAECYRNLLRKFPNGIISIVADTWDVFNATDNIFGRELRTEIMAREGVTLPRPDSGDARQILPWMLDSMYKNFSGEINAKNYKVLNEKVRIIQGDNVSLATIDEFCQAVEKAGFSLDNMVWGSGGGLLRNVNRDTFKFAQKASATEQNGVWVGCKKDPVTDNGKGSKEGLLGLKMIDGQLTTYQMDDPEDPENLLEVVFRNGEILRHQTFEEIRNLASTYFQE